MSQWNGFLEDVKLDEEMIVTKKFPYFSKRNSPTANSHDSKAMFIHCINVLQEAC